MWGTCKIVNFSWLLFATLNDWSKSFNIKNTLSKWSLNTFYRVNGLSVGLCILCVKMRTFLCGESTLPHNKRNCFPPYPDHYLMQFSISLINPFTNDHLQAQYGRAGIFWQPLGRDLNVSNIGKSGPW